MQKNNDDNTDRITIIDNFLEPKDFLALDYIISTSAFPWYWSPTIVYNEEEREITPGIFDHAIYQDKAPCSRAWEHIQKALNKMDAAVLLRIVANLNWRLPEAYKSTFHADHGNLFDATQWTTSVLYINTNNGYTELETGEKIESVENRLVSFPANTKHRGVSQTDEQRRILINFNYLKKEENEEK